MLPGNQTYKIAIAILIVLVLSGFSMEWNSLVKGSVNPSDAGLRAWLISRTDTLNTPVERGIFEIVNVRPGNYTLMIEGRPPYRNAIKDGITVVDGQPTDVGVIDMQQ